MSLQTLCNKRSIRARGEEGDMPLSQKKLLNVAQLKIGIAQQQGYRYVVNEVDFSIERGQTFALVGESGSGKTLTALSLMRLLPQSATLFAGSKIQLNGLELTKLPEVQMRDIRGQRVSMIFQEPGSALNPVLTIGEQIREVLVKRGLSAPEQKEKTLDLLHAVRIPDPKQRAIEYPHQLSGGLKQRAMIALALAGEPDLLIADEPTTALDVTIQAQILQLLSDLQSDLGMAILLITHDLGVVREIATHVAVMYAGHIVETASTADFFAQPQHPYSQQLFAALPRQGRRDQSLASIPGYVPNNIDTLRGCRFTPRCQYAFSPCATIPPGFTVTSPHHDVRCHLRDPHYSALAAPAQPMSKPSPAADIVMMRPPQHKVLLDVSNLVVHYPVRTGHWLQRQRVLKAVDNVSFTIHHQQVVALVGESGCGKTSTAKALVRLQPSTAGQVHFNAVNLLSLSSTAFHPYRKQLQLIFQDPFAAMNPRLLVQDIIAEGLRAFRLAGRKERDLLVSDALEQVGLPAESRLRYPHEFSGGQRQRIDIARALVLKPQLLICDEPTSGLDVSVQAQIVNLLRELRESLGLSYLIITHNLGLVGYLADVVVVMYLGQVVEQGPVEKIINQPLHPYTQSLIAAVPNIEADKPEAPPIIGELPSPLNPPSGCYFHTRCPLAHEECKHLPVQLRSMAPDHQVRCVLYE
jgi:peptide/nickel transport system ATP-binding protein